MTTRPPSAAVDRHVPQAARVERLTRPPAPAGLQAQPGEAGHEVELAGPDVAQHERVELDARAAEPDVALVDALGDAVEAPDLDRDAVGADLLRLDVLVDAAAVLAQARTSGPARRSRRRTRRRR